MRIYGDDNVVRLEVMREMTGTGALLITMSEEDANADNANVISSRLEALMRAETFRGYPMYFPLLDENSLRKMSREELESLLPGCLLYFREDTVENAALIVSRIRLDQLFGTQRLSPRVDDASTLPSAL